MSSNAPADTPKVAFRVNLDHSLYWHLVAKYGDAVPVNPILMSAVNLRYRMENAILRDPSVLSVLRELAYRLDDWSALESAIAFARNFENSDSIETFETYVQKLKEGMAIEVDHYRPMFENKRRDLEGFLSYLRSVWGAHGAFVLKELSRLTGEPWPRGEIRVELVTDSLNTGMFRRDFLVLPYPRNHDQGLCVLLHLLTRYLTTQKVLDIMSQFTGPCQDLYLDALYGLVVNAVLSRITSQWTGFEAPIEPRGGLEYKIFQRLLPHWRDHLENESESFEEFVKRRVAADFIPNRLVLELIKQPNLVAR
jgi:hypothetical protein